MALHSFLRARRSSLPTLGLALAGVLALGGCQSLQTSDSFLGFITPYKVEIVQGNVVTSEQAALVKPGMNRAQVRDVLGTPLLADPFHANRWDYVFTIRRQGAAPQARRIKVLFDGDVLKSIDTGGALPSEQEFVASIDTFKPSRRAPELELTPEQLKALPVPPKPATVAAEPVGPTRTYPPLEPLS
ncbi:MAG: outer membrane protein assembly factor BamE [Burkholderiales bacterium]|nr:outer membrane protein assembly factor BamE [Burkholderiales bacterium]MDE2298010.1 outer membrane protein assembly factor BamE [Burkholderiales bacterium]MDE2627214.1 outer membrane protein assembly factor BamE [Burkholderiales bacterium]